MGDLLNETANYLLRQSWQIAAVIGVVAAAAWVLRRSSAHWRYLLWLVVLAKCLVPPLLTVPLGVLPEGPGPAVEPARAAAAPHAPSADDTLRPPNLDD
ncbi:MAG TPA: hypothetical protein VMZ50_04145, partial [Phycisphaerae bacterium]|nr:hypothetical protein [Phycisphaerae bacterium]